MVPHSLRTGAQVIVVGAGPVGMTAALLLAKRGIRVLLVERQATPTFEPKAISLDDESLRTYQSIGIDDRVLSIVVPGTGTKYYGASGQELFHARGPSPYRLGQPFKNPFAQPDLEILLRQLIADESRVQARYGANVERGDDDGDRVRIRVRSTDQTEEYEAPFLIGADGGRSTVRESLSIGMTGTSADELWIVIDTIGDWHDERYGMHHGDPLRPHVIVPGLQGRCRYEFRLLAGEGAAGESPPFELMQRLVSRYRALEPHEVERAVVYRFHSLSADRWSTARTFLVGDAAHMMPPFAGQGLNSGIRDVANIAWKLAEVLDGTLRRSALTSYEAERRPHAEATIGLSDKLGRIVMTTSGRLAERRDRLIARAMRDRDGREFLEQMRFKPQASISTGLVSDGYRAPVGMALPQPRVFDSESHRPRMLDDVLGMGWGLVGVGVTRSDWSAAADIASIAGARSVHIPTDDHLPRSLGDVNVIIDVDGMLDREFGPFKGHFMLVRPDRIVAVLWLPDESDSVRSMVNKWFTSE